MRLIPALMVLAALATAPRSVAAAAPASPSPVAAPASAASGPVPAVTPARAPARSVSYDVTFDARIVPSEGVAHVAIRLGGNRSTIHWLRFQSDPTRYAGWKADGSLEIGEHWVEWQPPKGGGEIRYTVVIDHLRNARAYDARCADDWVLMRGHDLVPTVRIKTEDGVVARSKSILRLHVPAGWRIVTADDRKRPGTYVIDNPATNFDRPTSWILAGRLGILRETIAGMKVAVAGPRGQGVHRQDILAMLRWTMPKLRRVLGRLPERLVVVSAGDPMWRGGLSAPRSLFLHADRPMITSDLTSPLLHETIHALVGVRSGPESDWIVEGLAEYYSLQLLLRSKTVSQRRYDRAFTKLKRRGRDVRQLRGGESRGATTARAVVVLADLDAEIRDATDGEASLDTVLARIARSRKPITNKRFQALAEKVSGRDLGAFFSARVGRIGK